MIKAGGIWVSPAEVEAVLIEHPDVLEAAVVGSRDAAGLEMTVAFVVARQGRTIDAAAIDAHCRARMAAFKRPRRLDVVDELPKTATGKIQRFRLRDRAATPRGDLGGVYAGCGTSTAQTSCSGANPAQRRKRSGEVERASSRRAATPRVTPVASPATTSDA